MLFLNQASVGAGFLGRRLFCKMSRFSSFDFPEKNCVFKTSVARSSHAMEAAIPEITITPRVSLVDEKVRISVKNLQKHQPVTITSSVKNDNDRLFRAYSHYNTDQDGSVDLTKDASCGGDYKGLEPMGLFWAQKIPACSDRKYSRLNKKDVTTPQIMTFNVYEGHLQSDDVWEATPKATKTIERWYLNDSVERIPLNTGRLNGVLFVPKQAGTYPAVIDLRGGSGILMEFRPSLLACHGFVTLALAYPGVTGSGIDRSREESRLDMSYFEEAVVHLQNHPKVRGSGVGVLGISMGGAIAVTMAGCMPGVACAISINAPVFAIENGYSYKGKIWEPVHWQRELIRSDGTVFYFVDALGLPKEEDVAAKILPFAQSDAPLLFLMSGDDGTLRLDKMAVLVEQSMQAENKTNYRIISYPHAGHLIEPPFSPLVPITYFSKQLDIPVYYGGKPEPHARAQEDAWRQILNFLENSFSMKSSL